MAVTRIKNNQITDNTIEYPKIKDGTLVGTKFNANITLNSNVVIIGNLQVSGNTSTVSSIDTLVGDPLITLNNGYVGTPAYDVGVLFNRALGSLGDYGGVNAALVWSESDGAFIVVLTTETGTTQGTIARTFQANLIAGNVNVSNLLVAESVRISSLDVGAVHTELLMSSAGNIVANSGTTSPIGVYNEGAIVVTGEGGVGIGGNLNVRGLSNFNGNITAGNIFVTGNINAIVGAVASNYGVFYGNAGGIGALYAGVTTYTPLDHTVFQMSANLNNYAQLNFQNTNNGAFASGDIVVTADNGDDNDGYINMGINSSNFNDPDFPGYYPNDGYLVMHGIEPATGNLNIHSHNTGSVIKLIVGAFGDGNVRATVTNTGFRVNTATASTSTTTGALLVDGGVGVAGNIYAGAIRHTGIISGYADDLPIGANIRSSGAFTTLTSNGLTTVTNATNSSTTTDGAFVVTGGVGIGGNLNVAGNTVIQGNLTVQGDITSLNVSTLDVEDLNITVAKGAINSMAADGAGLTVDGANATILYVNADDSWTLNKRVNQFELIVANLNATHSNATTSYAGNFSSPNVVITGGYINDLVNLTATTTHTTNFSTGNARITGGYADNYPLGMNIAAPATFTTANSTIINAETATIVTVHTTNGNVTTLYAQNFNSPNVAITGGYADNMPIGANVAAPGTFTTLTATSSVNLTSGNLVLTSEATTPYTDPSGVANVAGALIVTGIGGAAINGNLYVGQGVVINGKQTTHDTIVRGINERSLIYAVADTVYDQVTIGGNLIASNVTQGAKLQINSTDSLLIPVGQTADRPSNKGFTDVNGMIRYNNTNFDIEYYSQGEWRNLGNTFTTITQRTYQLESGDPNGNVNGVNTVFVLPFTSYTNGTVVSLNGVVQIPSIAYNVVGTTLTFTEAPMVGDVIDVRVITTTMSITNMASPNGYNQFDANNNYLSFYTGNVLLGAIENWRIDTWGDFYPVTTANIGTTTNRVSTVFVENVNQTGTTTVNNTPTYVAPNQTDAVTRFHKDQYHSGKVYVHLAQTSGTHYQASDLVVVHNGLIANITAMSSWTSAANLATFSANISGDYVYINASSAGANLTVKAHPTLMKIGQ